MNHEEYKANEQAVSDLTTDRRRVHDAVMEAAVTEMFAGMTPSDLVPVARLIADRVASRLQPAMPELSTEERDHLSSIRSQLSYAPGLWRAELATLDRMIGAKP